MDDENKRLSKLIGAAALSLLGMGTLVAGSFPIGVGYLSGTTGKFFSVAALIAGIACLYSAVKGVGTGSTRALGDAQSPEESLRTLARRYRERGNIEESLKTL